MKFYVILFASIFYSDLLFAEPEIKINYQHYNIYPTEKNDFRSEIQKRTPIKEKYAGYTKWYVKWNYKFEQNSDNCKITTVQVKLDVKYTMPMIPFDYHVQERERAEFNKYYDALLEHEKGHKDSGLFAAQEIEEKLQNMRGFSKCNKLKKYANQTAKDIIKKYNKRDIRYDKITHHGQKQHLFTE